MAASPPPAAPETSAAPRPPLSVAPLSVAPAPGRLQAVFQGAVLADAAQPLVARTADGETTYFPPETVALSSLGRNGRLLARPEGEVALHTLIRAGRMHEDAAWCCEAPAPGAAALGGFIAFDPAQVSLRPADGAPPAMLQDEDRALRTDIAQPHRDSGTI